jgi:hypothetical protein
MENLTFDPIIGAGIGLVAFAINYVGTYEVQRIQGNEPLKAGVASATNVLLGSILMYAFINNPLYMIPEMLGSFAGTYIQVNRNKKIPS